MMMGFDFHDIGGGHEPLGRPFTGARSSGNLGDDNDGRYTTTITWTEDNCTVNER